MKLVSVIIPVYNADRYINETLTSLIEQSHTNFEAIIIDDHSTDSSWDIITSFCSLDNRFTAYKNIKKGAASARNYGFSLSKGSYIQYLDADDILHKDKIEIQINYLLEHQLDSNVLLGCQWQFFSKNIENLFGSLGPITINKTIFSNKNWLLSRPDMAVMGWLFSRSQIENAQGWDEELTRNDDGELLYRVLTKIREVHIIHKLLVYYRREENTMSLSQNLNKESLISWIKSAKTYKNVVSQMGEKGKIASDQFFFILYYFCLFKYPDLALECIKELYYSQNNYHTEDLFVNKIAKYIGFKNAKRFRIFTHLLRGLKYI